MNKRKEEKNRGSGIELYSVSWETENEQMAIKMQRFTNMRKIKNFMTIKVDQVSSSYWEILKQSDARRTVGSGKNSR